jgi:hypothetical protein
MALNGKSWHAEQQAKLNYRWHLSLRRIQGPVEPSSALRPLYLEPDEVEYPEDDPILAVPVGFGEFVDPTDGVPVAVF